MLWDDVSYVIGSKTRKSLGLRLESPITPTILSKELGIHLANVSRSLAELEEKKIATCLTPTKKVGKLYSLTKRGKEVLEHIQKMER